MNLNAAAACVVLVLTSVVGVFGQTKYISVDEYNSATGTARGKLRSVSYRSTYVQKFYESGKVVETRTTINENLPPDRSRIYFTVESNGRVNPVAEEIRIGDQQYSRSQGGNWTNLKLPPPTVARVESTATVKSTSTTSEIKQVGQYMVVNSTYANKQVRLYYEFKCRLFGEIMYVFESRYWIDADGLIVKQTDSQRNLTPDNITQLNSTEYEYNPKDLKIEAPIR